MTDLCLTRTNYTSDNANTQTSRPLEMRIVDFSRKQRLNSVWQIWSIRWNEWIVLHFNLSFRHLKDYITAWVEFYFESTVFCFGLDFYYFQYGKQIHKQETHSSMWTFSDICSNLSLSKSDCVQIDSLLNERSVWRRSQTCFTGSDEIFKSIHWWTNSKRCKNKNHGHRSEKSLSAIHADNTHHLVKQFLGF